MYLKGSALYIQGALTGLVRIVQKGDGMDSQELDYISSLFRSAKPNEKRDLFGIMPSKVLHRYYHCHTIPKKNGGSRNIYEPNQTLKRIQKRINRDILKNGLVSD